MGKYIFRGNKKPAEAGLMRCERRARRGLSAAHLQELPPEPANGSQAGVRFGIEQAECAELVPPVARYLRDVHDTGEFSGLSQSQQLSQYSDHLLVGIGRRGFYCYDGHGLLLVACGVLHPPRPAGASRESGWTAQPSNQALPSAYSARP